MSDDKALRVAAKAIDGLRDMLAKAERERDEALGHLEHADDRLVAREALLTAVEAKLTRVEVLRDELLRRVGAGLAALAGVDSSDERWAVGAIDATKSIGDELEAALKEDA